MTMCTLGVAPKQGLCRAAPCLQLPIPITSPQVWQCPLGPPPTKQDHHDEEEVQVSDLGGVSGCGEPEGGW